MDNSPWSLLTSLFGGGGGGGQNAQAPSPYPTYANQYGLGTNGAPAQGMNAGQNTSAMMGSAPMTGAPTMPLNAQPSDASSRGFNPWSMMGESNARK